jgi:hypothetical protein
LKVCEALCGVIEVLTANLWWGKKPVGEGEKMGIAYLKLKEM